MRGAAGPLTVGELLEIGLRDAQLHCGDKRGKRCVDALEPVVRTLEHRACMRRTPASAKQTTEAHLCLAGMKRGAAAVERGNGGAKRAFGPGVTAGCVEAFAVGQHARG